MEQATITDKKISKIAFVLDNIEAYDVLMSHLPMDTKAFLIDATLHPMQQMADIASQHEGLTALHVMAHGASGSLNFGTQTLCEATLSLYGKELLTISSAMSESGELFLYGCEVASGERGAAFVAMLQDVTGLKIAAATHKVGHSELGGSWELDVGMPIAQTLRVSAWNGLLATAPVQGTTTFNGLPWPTTASGTRPFVATNLGSTGWDLSFDGGELNSSELIGIYPSNNTVEIRAYCDGPTAPNGETLTNGYFKSNDGSEFALTSLKVKSDPLTGTSDLTEVRFTGYKDGQAVSGAELLATVTNTLDTVSFDSSFSDIDEVRMVVVNNNISVLYIDDILIGESEPVPVLPVLGGIAAEGNLKVTVLDDGTMVIDRFDGTAWNTQFYDPDEDQTNGLYGSGATPVSSGNIIEINGKTVPLGNYAGFAVADVFASPVPVISMNNNTITVVWTIDSTLVDMSSASVIASGTVVVTQRITLSSDTAQSIGVEWDITNNTGGELTDVRLARVVDSYLAGGDEGAGVWIESQNAVGVQKLTQTGIQQMFITSTGVITPADVQSGDYALVLDMATAPGDGLRSTDNQNTSDIEGINTDSTTDNGYGMEWIIPTLASGATSTIAATESFVASSVLTTWSDNTTPAGSFDHTY